MSPWENNSRVMRFLVKLMSKVGIRWRNNIVLLLGLHAPTIFSSSSSAIVIRWQQCVCACRCQNLPYFVQVRRVRVRMSACIFARIFFLRAGKGGADNIYVHYIFWANSNTTNTTHLFDFFVRNNASHYVIPFTRPF